MKIRILCTILSLIFSTVLVYASDKVHVSSLSDFSTSAPAKTIDVKVLEDTNLGEYPLSAEDTIHCNVIEVTKPKRGKIAAGFKVKPVYYVHDSINTPIETDYVGKYAAKIISKNEIKNIDAKKVGKKAIITVGNHFVKGVAPVASLAQGMIQNEDGNRIESGVKQVYKDSVFSYVQKGEDVNIKPGDSFYVIFKNPNSDDISDSIGEGVEEN